MDRQGDTGQERKTSDGAFSVTTCYLLFPFPDRKPEPALTDPCSSTEGFLYGDLDGTTNIQTRHLLSLMTLSNSHCLTGIFLLHWVTLGLLSAFHQSCRWPNYSDIHCALKKEKGTYTKSNLPHLQLNPWNFPGTRLPPQQAGLIRLISSLRHFHIHGHGAGEEWPRRGNPLEQWPVARHFTREFRRLGVVPGWTLSCRRPHVWLRRHLHPNLLLSQTPSLIEDKLYFLNQETKRINVTSEGFSACVATWTLSHLSKAPSRREMAPALRLFRACH